MTPVLDIHVGKLWIGCREMATRSSALASNFITARIQCVDQAKFQLWAMDGMTDLYLDAGRAHTGELSSDEFVQFILQIFDSMESGGHVLSFCFNGSHRSPVVVAGVVMLYTRASADDAMRYVHSLRNLADFWSRYHTSYTGAEFLRWVEADVHTAAQVPFCLFLAKWICSCFDLDVYFHVCQFWPLRLIRFCEPLL